MPRLVVSHGERARRMCLGDPESHRADAVANAGEVGDTTECGVGARDARVDEEKMHAGAGAEFGDTTVTLGACGGEWHRPRTGAGDEGAEGAALGRRIRHS